MILSWPVAIGALFLTAALIVFGLARPPQIPPFEPLDQTLPAPVVELREVELVLISSNDFTESRRYLTLELPQDPAQAYRQLLAALKAETPLWPQALPLPVVYLVQETVVLDFTVAEPIRVSVAQELALLESIETTLQRNGAAAVRFLVNHHAPETFLGNVAVRSSLE